MMKSQQSTGERMNLPETYIMEFVKLTKNSTSMLQVF